MKIKDVNLIDSITGTEKVPVSAGTDAPATVSLDQIKEYSKVIPDWNAQEEEAGYIENKPFYKIITANSDSCISINFDGNLEISPSKPIYYFEYENQGFRYGDTINLYFFDGMINYMEKIPVIKTDTPIKFTCPDKNNLTEQTYTLYFPDMDEGQFDLILTPHHCVSSWYEEGYYLTVKIDNYNSIIYDRTFTFGVERILDQQTLDVSNIEGALSYNSKQYLQTEEKNQALINLGIDPVVWKYLLNPYAISIIYDGAENTESGWLIDSKILDSNLVKVLVNNPEIGRLLIVINNDTELYTVSKYIKFDKIYSFDINTLGVTLELVILEDGTIEEAQVLYHENNPQ